MTIDRRKFIQNSSKLALIAGVPALSGIAQLSLTGAAQAEQVAGLHDDLALPDKWLGKDDAPVTIIEYASMTCPYCRRFHEETLAQLKKNYIDTGKVRLIFREFPLDNLAAAAAMLARCAPNDNFFPLIDTLFKQQSKWARSSDPVSELLKISRLAGFSQETFNACLRDQDMLNKVIATRTQASEKFKVNATPTFFLNDVKYSGDFSYEVLSKAIDSLL